MGRGLHEGCGWNYRLATMVLLAAATAACSTGAPPPETIEHRYGREMGVNLREEGAWPNISRSRAEKLCQATAKPQGYDEAQTDDYVVGCTDELLAQ
ncbi:hypothetical protein ACWGK1_33930 [Streptomyces wedmorensis]